MPHGRRVNTKMIGRGAWIPGLRRTTSRCALRAAVRADGLAPISTPARAPTRPFDLVAHGLFARYTGEEA